jgi:hypothetical protein
VPLREWQKVQAVLFAKSLAGFDEKNMPDQLFDELYRLLRGTPSASALVEAKSLYSEEKYAECVRLLESTTKSYTQSRTVTLSKDLSHVEDVAPAKLDRETKKLVRKQEKANDVLEQMQELIEKVRRSIRLSGTIPRPVPIPTSGLLDAKPTSIATTVESDDMRPLRELLVRAINPAQELEVIEAFFEIRPLNNGLEIQAGDTLLAMSGGKHHLLMVNTPAIKGGALSIRSAIDGSRMKPLPLDMVNRSIQNSKLHLAMRHPSTPAFSRVSSPLASGSPTSQPPLVETPSDSGSRLSIQQRDQILDPGAFSQLVDAAQRTGIVPGIATIIQVRDCEFRLGKYHLAMQLMESQLSAFVGSVSQRAQRLKREDQDIASGRVKMSPKDMAAKRARDSKETELIERARTRFTRVLEGIRGIIHFENELGQSEGSVE